MSVGCKTIQGISVSVIDPNGGTPPGTIVCAFNDGLTGIIDNSLGYHWRPSAGAYIVRLPSGMLSAINHLRLKIGAC